VKVQHFSDPPAGFFLCHLNYKNHQNLWVRFQANETVFQQTKAFFKVALTLSLF
jgi:hypothetical protein